MQLLADHIGIDLISYGPWDPMLDFMLDLQNQEFNRRSIARRVDQALVQVLFAKTKAFMAKSALAELSSDSVSTARHSS